jgi:hypothetical protein
MQPQDAHIKSHMQVISADGRRVGYVERITETEIITVLPCRHISLASIRRVTDDVYIAQRYDDLQEIGRASCRERVSVYV